MRSASRWDLLRITLLCTFILVGRAGAQSLDWVRQAGGTGNDAGQAVSVDAAGNSYVMGTFEGTATFDGHQLQAAGRDIFVAKYDGAGILDWVHGITPFNSAGGGGTNAGWDIATDPAGHSYITGSAFQGASEIDFGNGCILTNPAGAPNNAIPSGAFAAKFDTNGNCLWATNLEPPGQAASPYGHGFGIDFDGVGNSYIAGLSPDPVLGGGAATVWKVDPNGSVLWVRQGSVETGSPTSRGNAIAVDSAGSSYVVGRVQRGAYIFGAGEANETTISDINSSSETFVAKYDSLGNLMWARQSDDVLGSFSFGTGVAVDDAWNVYVVGNGPTTLEGMLVGGSVQLVWIAKYDQFGNLRWVRSSTQGEVEAIATEPSGESYITGRQAAGMIFGVDEPTETLLTGRGIFVAKYASDGSFVWARNGTVDNIGFGWGIAVNSNSEAHVAGAFRSAIVLGSGEPNETVLSGGGLFNIFIAKFENDLRPPALQATKVDHLVGDNNNNGMADGGDTVEYTIVLSNTGGMATDVSFADTPDPNTALVVGSVTTSQGGVTFGNIAGHSHVEIDVGSVGGGDSVTIQFRVEVSYSLPDSVTAVSNQGMFALSGAPDIFTDDPDDPTSLVDATVTPVVTGSAGVLEIESLISTIQDLVAAGGLAPQHDLTVPLEGAVRALTNGNVGAACSQLHAFVLHVDALVAFGAITAEDGLALTTAAASILGHLGC